MNEYVTRDVMSLNGYDIDSSVLVVSKTKEGVRVTYSAQLASIFHRKDGLVNLELRPNHDGAILGDTLDVQVENYSTIEVEVC